MKETIKKLKKRVLYPVDYVTVYDFGDYVLCVYIPTVPLLMQYTAYRIEKDTLKATKHKWKYDIIEDGDYLDSAISETDINI